MNHFSTKTLSLAAALLIFGTACNKLSDNIQPVARGTTISDQTSVATTSGQSGVTHYADNGKCATDQVAIIITGQTTSTCVAIAGLGTSVQSSTDGRFKILSSPQGLIDSQNRMGSFHLIFSNGQATINFYRPAPIKGTQATEDLTTLGLGFRCLQDTDKVAAKVCVGDAASVNGNGVSGPAAGVIQELFDNGQARVSVVGQGEDFVFPIGQLGVADFTGFTCIHTPHTAACNNLSAY